MIPLPGVYLLMIIAGPPELIGLKQQPDMATCRAEFAREWATGKFVAGDCITQGAIRAPAMLLGAPR